MKKTRMAIAALLLASMSMTMFACGDDTALHCVHTYFKMV